VYAAFPGYYRPVARPAPTGPAVPLTLSASPYFTARYFVRRASRESTPHMVSREISFDRDIAGCRIFPQNEHVTKQLKKFREQK